MDAKVQFVVPVVGKVIVCKDVRQKVSREADPLEHVILRATQALRKISSYEILFIIGLKTIMLDYVESVLYTLYQGGYLDIEREFDLQAIESNFHHIFKEVYGEPEPNDAALSGEACIVDSENRLSFTKDDIRSEMERIIKQHDFIYQYRITPKGNKALSENQIQKNDDAGFVSFCSLMVRDSDGSPTLLNLLTGIDEISLDRQFKDVDPKYHSAILALLKESSSFLRDKKVGIEVTGLTPSSEIKERSMNGNLILDYTIQNSIIKASFDQTLKPFDIIPIIEKNPDTFKDAKIIPSDVSKCIQDLIQSRSKNVDSVVLSENGFIVTVKALDFTKEDDFLEKILVDHDSFKIAEIIDTIKEYRLRVPLKVIPTKEDRTVIIEYVSRVIAQRYLRGAKQTCMGEVSSLLTKIFNNANLNVKITKTLLRDVVKNLETRAGVILVDDIIEKYLSEHLQYIMSFDEKPAIIKRDGAYRVAVIVNKVDIAQLKTASTECFSGIKIPVPVNDAGKIEILTSIIPGKGSPAFYLLLAKELCVQHANTPFVSQIDFIHHVDSILYRWRSFMLDMDASWTADLQVTDFGLASDPFRSLDQALLDIGGNYHVLHHEIRKYRAEIEAELSQLPGNFVLSEPINENAKTATFDLVVRISSSDLNILLVTPQKIELISKSTIGEAFLNNFTKLSKKISDQASISVNLHRTITISGSQQDELRGMIVRLFYHANKKKLTNMNRKAIVETVLEYCAAYNNFAKIYEPGATITLTEKLATDLIITEFSTLGFEFRETTVTKQIKQQYGIDVDPIHIHFGTKAPQSIAIALDADSYNRVKKILKESKISTDIKLVTGKTSRDFDMYFLPVFHAYEIEEKPFIMDYVTLMFDKYLQTNKIGYSMPKKSFQDHLVAYLTRVQEILTDTIGRPSWTADRLGRVLADHFDLFKNHGTMVIIQDELIANELLKTDLFKRIKVGVGKNRIKIDEKGRLLIFLSKTEISKIDLWQDLITICSENPFKIDLAGERHTIFYRFLPLDASAVIDFVVIRHMMGNLGKPGLFKLDSVQARKRAIDLYAMKNVSNLITEKEFKGSLQHYKSVYEKSENT